MIVGSPQSLPAKAVALDSAIHACPFFFPEVWDNVDAPLRVGSPGLPGGDSLARLLARRFGVRNVGDLPPLEVRQIVRWADDHFGRTGRWPTATAGEVAGAPGETWARVDDALRQGYRGLPGGDSLARLLCRERGRPNPAALPALRHEEKGTCII